MRLPTLPSREDLSLLRMRNAFRTSEVISSLLTAVIFWPLLFVEILNVAVFLGFIKTANFRAMLLSMLFGAMIFFVVGALYWLFNWFFSSAGWLVAIVSLGISGICFYLWMRAVAQFLLLTQAGKSDLRITFAIAFSQAVTFFFFLHSVHVGLLESLERSALSRNPFKEFAEVRIRQILKRKSSVEFSPRARASVLLLIAKMAQGLSTLVFSFVVGSALFWAVFGPRIAIKSGFQFAQVSLSELQLILFLIVAVYGTMLAIGFLLTQAAFYLKRRARYLTRFSYAQTVDHDERPPILFLRSFMDDQVTLPKPSIVLTYWMAEPVPRRLDHALVERFGYLAPVVAIGKPDAKEEDLPFGAARYFVPGKEWEPTVCEFAGRAQHVVVVVDDSPGIDWEVKTMLTEPFIDKSLFLASPKLAPSGLETHPRIAPLLPSNLKLSKNYHVLAAFRDDNTWRWLLAKKITADDYIVCCQAFLRRDLAKATSGIITETS